MFIIIIIIIIIVCYLYIDNNITEEFNWVQPKNCKYKQPSTLLNILKKNNKKTQWDLYIPCTYNNIAKEIDDAKKNKFIFLLEKCDTLTFKNKLWEMLVAKFGIEEALKIMPDTYLLKNINMHDEQYHRLINNFSSNKTYVMKKNIQQQKGIKLTNRLEEILAGYKNQYVICQELLTNPYLIDGHKINLRIYLLLICANNKLTGYIHRNGFMYYTPEKFKKDSLETARHITTGYIDREIYERNPLTLEDFRNYLNKQQNALFSRIKKLLGKVLYAADDELCARGLKLEKATTFQLFGVDIAVSNDLQPLLMEINKGPDMNGKDARDKAVKTKVLNDMLDILKITDTASKNNDFELI